MTSPRPTDPTEHPDDVTLVAFLDCELSPAESNALRRHADDCADCRARIRDLLESFRAFRAAAVASMDELPPLAKALHSFSARLSEAAGRHSSARLARGRRWQRGGAVAASLLAATGLLLMAVPGLSADSVLAHAEITELIDQQASDGPIATTIEIVHVAPGGVSRRVGKMARVDGSGSSAMHVTIEGSQIETWTGLVSDARELPAHIPWQNWFGDGIARYARETGWVPDVTVAAYRQLVALEKSGATVRRSGRGLEVHCQLRRGHPTRLSAVVLRIDASTGLPYELALVTADGGSSILSRGSLERLHRADTPTLVLTPPKPAPITAPGVRPLPAARETPRRLAYADATATETEVLAVEAVHRAGADLGEEVAVTPMSDGSVVVEGVISTSARASALARALRGLAQVRSTVQSADAPRAVPRADNEHRGLTAEPIEEVRFEDLSATSLPVLELLEAAERCDTGRLAMLLPSGEHPVASYATQVVEQSSTALVHAWALERLHRQFDARRTTALRPEARSRLDRLINTHRVAARAALRAVQASVTPLATSCGVVDDAPVSSQVLADSDIPAIAREQNQLVRALFARTRSNDNAASTLRLLVTVLRRLG